MKKIWKTGICKLRGILAWDPQPFRPLILAYPQGDHGNRGGHGSRQDWMRERFCDGLVFCGLAQRVVVLRIKDGHSG